MCRILLLDFSAKGINKGEFLKSYWKSKAHTSTHDNLTTDMGCTRIMLPNRDGTSRVMLADVDFVLTEYSSKMGMLLVEPVLLLV